MSELLRVEKLRKWFSTAGRQVRAVNDVSFSLHSGATMALIGESGCGKSTTARCILRLIEADSGAIWFAGTEVTRLPERAFRPMRKRLQMVFQDATTSLNPRLSVRQILSEPLRLHHLANGAGVNQRLAEVCSMVALEETLLDRFPQELSIGQKQRVGIARAIITRPDCVILDEPTSSLDMSVKVQIVQLLLHLQKELKMAYLFISHDLSTVRHVCDYILVMYLGEIVEAGPVSEIFSRPLHPYTRALLSAIPIPDPEVKRERILLKGETPSLTSSFRGCILHHRCPEATSRCYEEKPEYYSPEESRRVACFLQETTVGPRLPRGQG